MEIEGTIMPGCKKCTKLLMSQFTEYEDYFQFVVYVCKTMFVQFSITISLLQAWLLYEETAL